MVSWEVWRALSAGVAGALVVVLLTRHIFEARLEKSLRQALDWIAAPLLGMFFLYIATDFLLGRP